MFKFSGAGNDFVVLDGRGKDTAPYKKTDFIVNACNKYSTDGLMVLGTAPGYDFRMDFFNPDGSGGMMCGNGGRCITAFASMMGVKPSDGKEYRFLAPDGEHTASILEENIPDGKWTVRLRMIDVNGIAPVLDGFFLNTGTRHFVKFVPDVDNMDVEACGRTLRHHETFAPEGTNVNFVQVCPDGLKVRTFEKGVEGETLACGTGLTASALAFNYLNQGDARANISLRCRRGDILTVEFSRRADSFRGVYLTGPAELVEVIE